MADLKITELDALGTTPNDADILAIVDDVAGTPLTKKVTVANLLGGSGVGLPVGAIVPYGGSAAPTGFLLCNDQAVSRTTYSALFTVISDNYGVGDGSTTFNVPDLRGSVPVGLDAGTFSTLGATGGEETHVITEAELAAHVHTIAIGSSGGFGATSGQTPSTTFDTGSVGSNTAHNNLQPYQVVNYIIKT